MKALTLHQPWATLIADGVKTIETRSWRPPAALIGQGIAIHAGKRLIANYWLNGPIRGAMYRGHGAYWRQRIPRGAVVCTARLSWACQVGGFEDDDHVWVRVSPSSLIREDPYGDFGVGRWLWFLEDIEPVDPPVPARGRQGLWNWGEPDSGSVRIPAGYNS